jgi:peroxiredoxin/predicted 2-oxoglutarate/Fe(II)-dependent dioxygenase YbiX
MVTGADSMTDLPTLRPGDPAPWFYAAASNDNQRFDLSSIAGRYVVLGFFGSAAHPAARAALQAVAEHQPLFDDRRATFFGVSVDPRDLEEARITQLLPGIRYFWDFDLAISRRYGALDPNRAGDGALTAYRAFFLVLDPMLRVIANLPLDRVEEVLRLVATLPPPAEHAGVEVHAPVLVLPRVFEPAFCRQLIALYQQQGGKDSGFMRDQGGKTVAIVDHRHKRRADCVIEDDAVRQAARARIVRRVVPEIHKAFQFTATRMERYIVCCYDAAVGGYFRAHRDNTTRGTAHRRFALTINLNAEEFEGGDLRFPEFGPRAYRAPTGGAVVFSCSLLHEATPVTSGRRFVFLPFLYDEEGARIRAQNSRYLADNVRAYVPDEAGAQGPAAAARTAR